MTQSAQLKVEYLKIPCAELAGLNPCDQLEAVCKAAKDRVADLVSSPLEADDLVTLLEYLESMAQELLDSPVRSGFRDTTGTSKRKREFDSRVVALAIGCRGALPLDITGFRFGRKHPTPRARELVSVVTTWNTATELLKGLKFLRRLGRAPEPLEVSGQDIATHIDFDPLSAPLIQGRTRDDLEPRAKEWERGWDNGDYLQRALEVLERENGVSIIDVLAWSRAWLQPSQLQGHPSTCLVDTVRSHNQRFVEVLRMAGRNVVYRDVRRFMERTCAALDAEFSRLWRESDFGWLCPRTTPIPFFLPVVEHGKSKCLQLLATTEEQCNRMHFRQVRLREDLQTKEARKATESLIQAASRELARYQVQLLWPQFPSTSNRFQTEYVCVGIEEDGDILGQRPVSEIDVWVFNRARREIIIGEVKIGKFACTTDDLSREYDNFGRGGKHRRQLAKKLKWVRKARPHFDLPWDDSADDWRVRGAIFTNLFPESVWAIHHELPGIAPIGSEKARDLLCASWDAETAAGHLVRTGHECL